MDISLWNWDRLGRRNGGWVTSLIYIRGSQLDQLDANMAVGTPREVQQVGKRWLLDGKTNRGVVEKEIPVVDTIEWEGRGLFCFVLYYAVTCQKLITQSSFTSSTIKRPPSCAYDAHDPENPRPSTCETGRRDRYIPEAIFFASWLRSAVVTFMKFSKVV